MPSIETRVDQAWWAKQTAKGSPAAAAFRRGRKVGGDMTVNREDAAENYSDGTRFGGAADFVNTLVGNGAPVLQGQPGVIGHLAYLMCGQETVTGAAPPYTHVATPAASSFWTTWWKKVGQAVGPLREKYNDCRLVSLRIEGSSATKTLHITPTFVSLDAGEKFVVDPVAVEEGVAPFLYTEAVGTFTVNGAVIRGHSSFAIVINDSVTPWYGDDVTPYDVGFGVGNITIEGVTILVDQSGLDFFNTQLYGSASPAAGTKPSKTAPVVGSYSFDLVRGAAYECKVELPGVHWSPDMAIAGNPDGGVAELGLGAEARPVAGQPLIKITTKSDDPAYT